MGTKIANIQKICNKFLLTHILIIVSTILLSFLTNDINTLKRIFLINLFIVTLLFIWFYQFSLSSINHFAAHIINILEHMIDGKNIINEANQRDTLDSQIENKLDRLFNLLQKSKKTVENERIKLQSLISDISHQVKTPVANLKSINETLLRLDLPRSQQIQFLQNSNSELVKLTFSMEFLIKLSRLEVGSIILTKKRVYLFNTITNALNEVLISLNKKKFILA
jgi:signal transduction histidine kinase